MAKRRGKVEYWGPFFEHDPAKTLRQNMREASRQMATAGVHMLQAEYQPGRGSEIAPTIVSKQISQLSLWNVVLSRMSVETPKSSWVGWMESGRRRRPGGGDRISSATFKGIGAFRRVRAALKRQAKITAEQLLKGVA